MADGKASLTPGHKPGAAATPKPHLDPDPELVSKIAEVLRPRLRDPSQSPRAAAEIIMVAEEYSGPVPHPRHLAQIEATSPGSAKTLIAMASAEQAHRHRLENLETLDPYLGLVCGFLAFGLSIAAAIYLGIHDKERVAIAVLGVPALGVIGWFIRSRLGKADRDPTAQTAHTKKDRGRSAQGTHKAH